VRRALPPPADTVRTGDRLRAGSYTVEWGEVVLDGVTYRPDPASTLVTLEPSLEPYKFENLYSPIP
jgi:hypothetical protein